MKHLSIILVLSVFTIQSYACDKCGNYNNDDFQIKKVSVKHNPEIGATIWEITVKGTAGKTTPKPAGQLNGAPVLGYVFPTTLNPTDVGFSNTEGILALALPSHPAFENT